MLLLQVITAMVITTILSTAFIQRNLNQDALAKQTIVEIKYIAEAAQKYLLRTDEWPEQDNNCNGAINKLRHQNDLLLIDKITPLNGDYILMCSKNNSLWIHISPIIFLYAQYIKKQIEFPSIIANHGEYSYISIHIPRPLEDTLHDKFLALGDTPTTNEIYDVGTNTIRKNNLDLLFLSEYTIDITAIPEEFIPKPQCTLPQAAKVHLSIGPRFTAANNKPIFGWEILIDTARSNLSQWALSVRIFTEDTATGYTDNVGVGSLIVAQTYCG